jgi:23S rRNA pseudouridine2605 synthase
MKPPRRRQGERGGRAPRASRPAAREAKAPPSAGPERLQKLIAAAGIASRRAAEELITAGRVTLNGKLAQLGDKADLAVDAVLVDGNPLSAEAREYWLLNKPPGVITTLSDPHSGDRRTVHDLLPREARGARLFPVGRLDVGSEGLVLMTNDGELAHALLHPSREVDKEYRVRVRGKMERETIERLRAGIELDDGPMRPAQVSPAKVDEARGETELVLVLREGRKREIRRAMDALGHRVVRLVRERMGPLVLARLPLGAARRLGPREVTELLEFARQREEATARARARSREPNAGARGNARDSRGSD